MRGNEVGCDQISLRAPRRDENHAHWSGYPGSVGLKRDDKGRMARRRVLALGLGGIARLRAQALIGGRKRMVQITPETVVYVSNAGTKEVLVLAMNRATGTLELIEKTPLPIPGRSILDLSHGPLA
jgi:hypothetical protein